MTILTIFKRTVALNTFTLLYNNHCHPISNFFHLPKVKFFTH